MIKINLIEKKKTFKAPIVLGFDFSTFPIKMFIISIIFTQLALSFFEGHLESISQDVEVVTRELRSKQKKLKKQIKKNEKTVKKLNVFNEKITALKKRGEQVDLIIKTRTNPRHLLEKIARLSPDKLWLNKLTINEARNIEIVGAADNYTSIGVLIEGLNKTAFFNNGLQLKDSKTLQEADSRYQIESFVIEGKVRVFNPFIEGER